MAYVSLEEFKQYRSITSSVDDALLDELLSNAQGYIESWCRRKFEASTDTTRYLEISRHAQGRTLRLDRDLCAITEVVNGDGTVLAASQYVPEPRNALVDGTPIYALTLRANAGVSWGSSDSDVAITGRWAYSIMPDSVIRQCTLLLASYLYEQRQNVKDLGRSFIADAGTLLVTSLPRDLFEFLSRRRRVL